MLSGGPGGWSRVASVGDFIPSVVREGSAFAFTSRFLSGNSQSPQNIPPIPPGSVVSGSEEREEAGLENLPGLQ